MGGGPVLTLLFDSDYGILKRNMESSPPSAAAEEGMGVGLNEQNETQ